MKVIIAGGRNVLDIKHVERAIAEANFEIDTVISGTSPGVDTLGVEWALINHVPVEQVPALWDVYGISAGPIRNATMARMGDAMIAIWDGKSRGTANMISQMQKQKKPIHVYSLKF